MISHGAFSKTFSRSPASSARLSSVRGIMDIEHQLVVVGDGGGGGGGGGACWSTAELLMTGVALCLQVKI